MTRRLAIALLCVLLAPSAQAAVTLKNRVTLDTAEVRLGDVFDGLDVGADRVIARAPQPGRSVTYDYTVLSKLARQDRLDWTPHSYQERAVITRASTPITADQLRAPLIDALRAQGVNGAITIAFDRRDLTIHLPTDAPATVAVEDLRYDAATGRFQAEALIAADHPAFTSLTLNGRALAQIEVPVLTHPLEAGVTIGASDLDVVTLPADRAKGMIQDHATLLGQETRRQLAAGQPLRPRDVMPPRLVRRGALVTMEVKTDVMTLTAEGRALQDGGIGDVIRVTNTHSKRTIEATVTGDGTVRVSPQRQIARSE